MVFPCGQCGHEEEIVLESDFDYELAARSVDEQEMRALISDLEALGSRVTGYPGADRAAEMIADTFRAVGLEDVQMQTFPLVVPVAIPDEQGRPASITVDGKGIGFEMLPMWPNLVRAPKTSPEGIRGNLIYAGPGNPRAFNGQEVTDSITMVDFNCQADWFNGPLLGTQAVLFVSPKRPSGVRPRPSSCRSRGHTALLDYARGRRSCWACSPEDASVPVTVRCDMIWKRWRGTSAD